MVDFCHFNFDKPLNLQELNLVCLKHNLRILELKIMKDYFILEVSLYLKFSLHFINIPSFYLSFILEVIY